MWTIRQIADRDGISKQAVSKRARRFADEHGLIVETDGKCRLLKLNVVQYDQLRGQFADPSKAQAPKLKAEQKPPAADSYDEARRTQAWLDAERSRLALEEQKGNVVRVDAVRAAFGEVGDIIAESIDRLPNIADDMAAEVIKNGPHALRAGLTKEANRMRAEIAQALRHAMQQSSAKPEDGAPPVQL